MYLSFGIGNLSLSFVNKNSLYQSSLRIGFLLSHSSFSPLGPLVRIGYLNDATSMTTNKH